MPLVPGFLLAFVVLMLLTSHRLRRPRCPWRPAGRIALAARGGHCGCRRKTSFEDLLKLGWVPVVMLLAETLWILGFAGAGLGLMAWLD